MYGYKTCIACQTNLPSIAYHSAACKTCSECMDNARKKYLRRKMNKQAKEEILAMAALHDTGATVVERYIARHKAKGDLAECMRMARM